jgi:sphinganine-1-phosphate aldolase
MLPKLELQVALPWILVGYFLLSRMRLYCHVRPFVMPALAGLLLWRAVFETTDVSILEYLLQIFQRYVNSPVVSHLVMDILGIVALNIAYMLIKSIFSFNLKEAYEWGFKLIAHLPMVSKELEKEHLSMEADLEKSLKSQQKTMGFVNNSLPAKGQNPADLLKTMTKLAVKDDLNWKDGRVSGAVYLGDDQHVAFLNKAFGLYSLSNPLHAELWPSVMKYESEVIAMVADMVNGGDSSVVGCVTSGGTESIVLAIKTHRDFYRAKYGITAPEMIACTSAHAAVNKGCDLLGVKLIHVPLDPVTFEINLSAVRRAVGPNTIMIYSSAPSFPHGVIDPIAALSDIALSNDIGLHVDCCLGGFVLPFAKKMGYDIPEFDFGLMGVTSMSCDTHKFGYALKGSSVVLYRNNKLRQSQYFCYTDWTGGMYATPTLAGSKSGGMVAQTWASMMSVGWDGYSKHAADILDTAQEIAAGVREIQGLKIVGKCQAMMVCFAGDGLNIYDVNDKMKDFGWHLNSLQSPPAMNICVTVKQVGQQKALLKDLRAAVKAVLEAPAGQLTGSAKLYGTVSALPAGPTNEIAKTYMDVVYKTTSSN